MYFEKPYSELQFIFIYNKVNIQVTFKQTLGCSLNESIVFKYLSI